MKKIITVLACISIFVATNVFAVEMKLLTSVLKQAKHSIDSALAELGTDLRDAAKSLAATDLKGDAARKILDGLRKHRPYIVNCSILNADGIKVAVEPAEYKQYEGAYRTELPYVVKLLRTKKPVLSDVYHSAENIHAITMAYPILSDKGELLGVVRMLISYEAFLKPLVEDKACKLWVMQKNGLIVYDKDPEEIGKNIFTDDIFKGFDDLIAFSKTVSMSRAGAGSYSFYANGIKDKTMVSKAAIWNTTGIYGTEWRIIAMEQERILVEPLPAGPATAK